MENDHCCKMYDVIFKCQCFARKCSYSDLDSNNSCTYAFGVADECECNGDIWGPDFNNIKCNNTELHIKLLKNEIEKMGNDNDK